MKRLGMGVILAAGLAIWSTEGLAQSHYATKQAQESYDSGIKLERRAEEKGEKSYLKDAEAAYREAISAEPNMAPAYVRLGYVLYALNRSEEGVEVLTGAVQRNPENVELKHYLGLNLYQSGKSAEAEALLTEVISARQDLPEAYFILGKINLDKGDSLRAQEYFAQYAAFSPDDAQAYRALASAYIQARDIAGAESALGRLLELAPEDTVAKINMGHVKYERGQVDEAVKLYEQAYKAEPRRKDLLYTIASAYYLSGKYAEAITRFDAVLEHDGAHMGAQYFKADSALKLGHLDEAERQFKALGEKMPDYRYIKLKLAYIRMLRGESGAADEVRNLMKDDDNADDLHFGAVVLRKEGFTDESLAIHRQLRDSHPGESIYGIYLAREYLQAKDYGQAAEILMAIIDESVNNTLAWEMLSMTLLHQGTEAMMLGEFERARALFDQSLSMDVHAVEAHCSMSQLAFLEGDMDQAFGAYQAAEAISADAPNVVKLAAQFDILDGAYDAAVRRLQSLENASMGAGLDGAGYYLLSVAHSNLGAWKEAADALAKAEKLGNIDPSASSVMALQGAMTAFRQKDFDAMEQFLSRVESFKEGLDEIDTVRYEYLSALSAVRAKKFSSARAALESVQNRFSGLSRDARGMITDSGTLDISFPLAYVYYETGNLDKALTILGRNTSGESRMLEIAVRRKLAIQAFKSKKYDVAVDNYNRLSSIGAQTASDEYNATLANLALHRLTNAGATLERYARQNMPEAVLNYAIYLDSTGEGAKATQYYEKYVAMTSARKSEDVRRMLLTKQRVWGSK